MEERETKKWADEISPLESEKLSALLNNAGIEISHTAKVAAENDMANEGIIQI